MLACWLIWNHGHAGQGMTAYPVSFIQLLTDLVTKQRGLSVALWPPRLGLQPKLLSEVK
jgi:hypothetical protein